MTMLANSAAARDILYQVHSQTNIRQHEKDGPLIVTRGEGAYIYDDNGNRYLDAMSGLWCVALGYSDTAVKDAVKAQIDDLPYFHLFAHRSNNPSIDLAEKLIQNSPGMARVIFQCSGSEANDTAVKLVWYYWNALGKPEKKKIIARKRAYHGTGVASGSLTFLPNIHREFDLPLDRFLHVTCPHYYREGLPGESEADFVKRLADELEQLIIAEGPDTVGGFFAEPVMGTGGVVVPPEGYFEAIQAVLKKYDVLTVSDEVICGFGRAGTYWGAEAVGYKPDMITCAKALSSAYLPISAVLVSQKILDAMREQSDKVGVFGHGYTYGGHPVCAAAALATLKRYEELGTTSNAREVGAYFQKRLAELKDHPIVGEVRGIGLMAGVELVGDKATKAPFDASVGAAAACSRFALERGLITRDLGQTMSFSPPLVVTRKEIDFIVDTFRAALDQTADFARAKAAA
ncbi:MAG: aminotransferase class III-fold pyridoxal phosphate-dependent enzyme [Mesorhizobium sp.]|nr:aminotransferase [Mesorhizobium sp.]MBN9241280.1 aminotransferase class III-fold pyridoxal phosphate-dependent enzyme [Mesorhizobium sp.]